MNNIMNVTDWETLRKCDAKFIVVDGYRFARDERTGYHRCAVLRKRLHQYVWIKYNGEVSEGFHVHHIDEDKSNNHISNLEILGAGEHAMHHHSDLPEEEKEVRRKNLDDNARPLANEWHRSDEGRGWHKEHYEKMKDKLHAKSKKKCGSCGDDYVGLPYSKFCSNNCKSKYRRDKGYDNVKRLCIICDTEFTTNKYSKAKTCSPYCRNKSRKVNRNKT